MIRIYVVSNVTVSAIRKHNANVILHVTIIVIYSFCVAIGVVDVNDDNHIYH